MKNLKNKIALVAIALSVIGFSINDAYAKVANEGCGVPECGGGDVKCCTTGGSTFYISC